MSRLPAVRVGGMAATLVVLAGASPAATLTDTQTLALTGPGVASAIALSFDPSKGELDRVEIEIIGAMVLRFLTAPNSITLPLAPEIPVPYTGSVAISHDFAGAFSAGALRPSFRFTAAATGLPALSPPRIIDFRYSFSFDAESDVLGLVLARPGSIGSTTTLGIIDGLRDDFTSPLAGQRTPLPVSLQPVTDASSDPRFTLVSASTDASLTVSYHYTTAGPVDPGGGPGGPGEPAVVPLPASLPLGLAGPALLVWLRRRGT